MLKRFLLILFIPFLMSGCDKNIQEEISFATWGSITEVQITKKIISEFESDNPNIKIRFMHIPQNYFQKVHLLFASNTAPDVIFINNLNIPIYYKNLEPLDFVNKGEYFPQTIEGLSVEGNLYAVPRDISNLVFYVNTDRVKLPNPDWKIEELTHKYYNNMFTVSYEDDVYWLMPYLSYFGGGVLNKTGNLIIDNVQSKKAINFYKDLKEKYCTAPTKSQVGSSTLAQMFIDGKIIFYLSGRWMYPKISEAAKFHWAVINFPYGASPQMADVSGWAISKTSKHKVAAKKFIEYLSSEKSSKYYTETGLIVPARKNVSKILNETSHNEKTFIDVIKHTESTTVDRNYKRLTDKINRDLDL